MPGRLGPARLRVARETLSRYPFGSLDIVLATLSETFGFKVTAEALGKAFEKAGWSSPEKYMADSPSSHCSTCTCRRKKR